MKLSRKAIQLTLDNNYKSGFGCDAKWVGTMLDEIIGDMGDKKIKILPELLELKQHLRHKGNSRLDNGDGSLWLKGDEEFVWQKDVFDKVRNTNKHE